MALGLRKGKIAWSGSSGLGKRQPSTPSPSLLTIENNATNTAVAYQNPSPTGVIGIVDCMRGLFFFNTQT